MNFHEAILELKKHFPELEEELDDDNQPGLYYNAIGTFSNFIQESINSHDKKNLVLCFKLVERFLAEGDSDLKNAIHVSLLEHLNFDDTKKIAVLGRNHTCHHAF